MPKLTVASMQHQGWFHSGCNHDGWFTDLQIFLAHQSGAAGHIKLTRKVAYRQTGTIIVAAANVSWSIGSLFTLLLPSCGREALPPHGTAYARDLKMLKLNLGRG